jgi:pimeloyl-ACP methyl ester carboxylesterase
MYTTTSADGTEVRAIDRGHGRIVVLLGPGLDDGSQNNKLVSILAKEFRVLQVMRRMYRTDLFTDPKMGTPRPTISQEVHDVEALVRAVGQPVLLYGHSSGAVVALGALAAKPDCFVCGVIFEPPAVIDENEPLSGPNHEMLREARTLLAKGKSAKARALPATTDHDEGLGGTTRRHRHRSGRALAQTHPPCKLNDCEAIDELGVRLDTYATIKLPVVMLGGELKPGPGEDSEPQQESSPHWQAPQCRDERAPERRAGDHARSEPQRPSASTQRGRPRDQRPRRPGDADIGMTGSQRSNALSTDRHASGLRARTIAAAA